MSVILEKFLTKNNYSNFNRKDISLQLQTHPKHPSFRAITDTLDYFGIENVAAVVPEGSLPSMPNTFLTLIDQNDPQLVLAVKKNDLIYTYFENKKREKFSFSDFNKIWSKEVIAIGEYSQKKPKVVFLNLFFAFISISILIAFLWLRDVTWTSAFVIALSMMGLYISLLLVKEKIGYHSETVHSICTSTVNSDCDEVINSKGAMLTKNISLADSSFLYFSILIFQNIFFGYNSVSLLVIIFSIPVIIFSIYYQGIVLKKWCPLCLGVAGVLILLNVLASQDLTFDLTARQATEILMTIAVLIPSYFFVKNIILTQKNNEEKLMAANRFKRNPDLIMSFMKNAKAIQDLGILQNEIRLGNQDAAHKVIAFTNPFCGFCKAAFESYVKIIKAHPNVEIWIRFNSNLENFEEASTKITARLIEVYLEGGQEYYINAYLNWFENKNEKDWLKKYGNPKFEEQTIALLEDHKNWAIKNSVSHTPATIIEGKKFPSSYGYEDLTHVITDIIE